MGRSNTSRSGRRKFIVSAGALGITGLAGCTGGGNGNDNGGNGGSGTQMRMRTSTESTAAYAMSEGIAAVVNENTNKVFVEGRPGAGSEANINALVRDEVEMVYMQSWTMYELLNDVGAFAQVDLEPVQIMHYYDLVNLLCTNQGWLSIDQIEEGAGISPTPSGGGGRPMLMYALDKYGPGKENFEALSIDFGNQGSAFSEGRLDVGWGTILNEGVEPGWQQEMKQTSNLSLLDWPEDQKEAMKADDRLTMVDLDLTSKYEWFREGWNKTPDQMLAPYYPYIVISKNTLDYDAVYSFLKTMYENRDSLGEYHSFLKKFQNDDWWVIDDYSQVPFHPAAADFYKEIGLWNDNLTRAEEQS